jgi:hypothetical protein
VILSFSSEARYRADEERPAADHSWRIGELECQITNFVGVIAGGERSAAVSAALKAAETGGAW